MEKSLAHAAAVDEPVILQSPNSSSRTTLYADPTFALDWDNDVSYHISRNLLHLRRYRRMSQAAVAKAMGSSQPAVARIEAGEENFTTDTLRRHIAALDGRFLVAIQPKEFPVDRARLWWERTQDVTDTTSPEWVLRFAKLNRGETHTIAGFAQDDTRFALLIVPVGTEK